MIRGKGLEPCLASVVLGIPTIHPVQQPTWPCSCLEQSRDRVQRLENSSEAGPWSPLSLEPLRQGAYETSCLGRTSSQSGCGPHISVMVTRARAFQSNAQLRHKGLHRDVVHLCLGPHVMAWVKQSPPVCQRCGTSACDVYATLEACSELV